MAELRRTAYAASGVDVDAGDRAVELMRAAVERTHGPHVLGGLGGFGAAVTIPPGFREPVLISATDGVGTKTAIAGALGRFDTIGRDLVAMCADDVVCSGAAPLFFLDYVAVGRLDPVQVADLVAGVAAGCQDAGCALVGGETAEHPGLMPPGEFDLAGFCVGVVERDELIDGSAVEAGDAIIGLASSGLHSNGFSLVRQQVNKWDLALDRPYQEQLILTLGGEAAADAIGDEPEHALATLGDVLLTPTTIYAGSLVRVRAALRQAGHDLRGIAHVTGGGLPGNVPRALPLELSARLDPSTWRVPSVARLIAALAGLDDTELRATFNAGIGMTVVVAPGAVPATLHAFAREGLAGTVIGEVTPADGGPRYVEGRLSR
ncbi:MAG TPA: phosphoribosylformylglycinamidine cyclo-ligase [Candidatus Limnocylindrales bacterium]|nr:phosphoribosylformylglycinamidine cyclo-ligase [Candidatus Limnocylindrales bacterium]